MSERPTDPTLRLVGIYDLERTTLIREAKIPLPPVTIQFEGGPCDGRTMGPMDVQPDEIEMPDEGRYIPYMTDPQTYVWRAFRSELGSDMGSTAPDTGPETPG